MKQNVSLKEDPRKWAIYARKSKTTDKGESILNQINDCKMKIRCDYGEVDDENYYIYKDEGYSGGNINRPDFTRMMDDMKANKIKSVVCYRLDRISRSTSDFVQWHEELQCMDVSFISISEHFDTSTPLGEVMLTISAAFAQLERKTIGERIRDNMYELAKTGRWLGGMTPTGYKSVKMDQVSIDGKNKKVHRLGVIWQEARVVKTIYNLYLEHNSLTRVEAELLKNHIKTKNDKNFSRFSIRDILANPVYLRADRQAWEFFHNLDVEIFSDENAFDGKHGVMAYNKTCQNLVVFDDNRKKVKKSAPRKMEEWIIAVGKHQGLISGQQWIKVQRLLEINSSKSYRKPRSNVALLSGLLRCGNCNSFMRPKLSTRKNAKGDLIYDYLCELKEKSKRHNCDMNRVNGNQLDEAICNEMKSLSSNNTEFIAGLEKLKQDILNSHGEVDSQIDDMKREVTKIERDIERLIQSLTDSEDATDRYFRESINKKHEEKERLELRIKEMESSATNQSQTEEEFNYLRDLLASYSHTMDAMTVEQKRQALRVFIERIIWDGINVHVLLFGSDMKSLDFTGHTENGTTQGAIDEPLGGNCE